MMVRVLRAQVPASSVEEFRAGVEHKLDRLSKQAGLEYASASRRPDPGGGEEVMVFEEWREPADVWAWTRGRLDEPRYLPRRDRVPYDLEIEHYEAVDLDAALRGRGRQDEPA